MLVQANASRLELSDEQYADIQTAGGRGMPPFTIRNASDINQNITKYAAPEGFIDVPIHTYMPDKDLDDPNAINDDSWEDQLGYSNCNYEFSSMV